MTLRINKPFTFKKNHKIVAKNVLRYDPSYLFKNNEVGVWYDPSDMSTMYTESTGSLPSALEAPVGLLLDKSKGLALGPELITNGDFNNGTTGWTATGGSTFTVSDGKANWSHTSSFWFLFQNINAVPGKVYELTANVVSVTGTVRLVINGGAGSTSVPLTAGITTVRLQNASANGNAGFKADSAFSIVIESVSIREVLGNHAYQTAAASRPVLSARYNLLIRSENVGAWGITLANVTSVDTIGPNGSNVQKIVPTSTNNGYVYQTVDCFQGIVYRISWFVKAAGLTSVTVGAGNVFGDTNITVDLTNGNITASPSGANSQFSIPLGNGWYNIGFTKVAIGTGIAGNYCFPRGTANGTDGVLVNGADFRVANDGVNIPTYQRVNTTTDYNTVDFPPYLRFDGVDDFLVSTNINLTNTDKMTAFIGVRKLSDPVTGASVIAETSADPNINNGQISIVGLSRFATPATTYSISSKGTIMTGVATSSSAYNAPVSNILTGQFDISGDICNLRIDSLNISTDNSDQGTGNFGNYPLYIGRRGGTILPFNGRIYSLIVRGAKTSTHDLLNTEKWVSGKTGLPYPVNIDRVLSEIFYDRSENTVEDVRNSTIVSKR